MDYLQSIRVFVRIAELGSYSRAARALRISNSLATRLVMSLESHLDARLFQRSTRRLSLTEQGQAYLECVSRILADLERAERLVAAHTREPAGTLRIAAHPMFSLHGFSAALSAYAQRYPRVTLDLTLTDRPVNLIEERFDVGVLMGRQVTGDSIVKRWLMRTRMMVCAAPAYLKKHGAPAHPEDLAGHAWLHLPLERYGEQLELLGPDGPVQVNPTNVALANNSSMLRQLAVLGMGIALLPCHMIDDDLREGRLVRLLADYHLPPADIHVAYPSRTHLPSKVRTFADHLVESAGAALDTRIADPDFAPVRTAA
ncbi:LysR family transcriptional regulator [Burkholderia stagnalis]|uniref:LysR family transcriptional regulator n=1 Tax=Burkholderia stagnalis TaxID=1503054 RepID=UPI000759AF85|nr:LysR family transcriptional regulator [Burkholderia stagnalis]KVM88482.1 LysR family transcriptional regulator [Burkholderia stagnalis]KVO60189.1 LysR family transcriptional regulator [Burkholderia stagnalis]KVP01438.1 LysR family transcriptional regulator [Burkholderia stagnalis]KVW95874.1 LysR family transcriptional regulator [Burkholderia stagnalis]KWH74679.1 LysR family transcriptional regulator [Burkholderia stagnalis]